MARGHIKTKKQALEADVKFDSLIVSKFINYIMQCGKKTIAEKIVYNAMDLASAKINAPAMDVLGQALKNVGPVLEVKSKRIGGANYQIPVEVNKDRKNTLAMRWIISAARAGKGKPMADKLASEIIDAYNGEGSAIKKRQDTHKMAEANKAFAHFARF